MAGATKYRLEEDDNPAFSSPIVRYLGYSTLYYVTGRLPGVRYYRVRTSNAAGFSPWSNAEMVVVQNVPPDAPILPLSATRTATASYLVDWSDVAGRDEVPPGGR